MFPSDMKRSDVPNIEILGAPIGDDNFCANFVAQKRENAGKLLTHLEEVGTVDPQVGLLLLCHCGSFSKLVHLARSIPPSLVAEALKGYDDDVHQCISECTSIDTTDKAWLQAQLSLNRGGLGLRSLSHHSSAVYIASLSASGQGFTDDRHSIQLYDAILSTSDTISAIDCMDKGFCLPSSKTISSWSCITLPPCLIMLIYTLYHHPMLQLGYL